MNKLTFELCKDIQDKNLCWDLEKVDNMSQRLVKKCAKHMMWNEMCSPGIAYTYIRNNCILDEINNENLLLYKICLSAFIDTFPARDLCLAFTEGFLDRLIGRVKSEASRLIELDFQNIPPIKRMN